MKWQSLPVKRVATVVMGQSPPSETYSDAGQGLPFLQGNAEFGAEHPTPRLWCESAAKRCQPGDILISVRAPVGAKNIADASYGIGRGLCAIRARAASPRYLWYAADVAIDELRAAAQGSTYEAVTAEDVADARVPVPPREVQEAIADFLDRETARIDRLIQGRTRLLDAMDERRRITITRAVTRGFTLTATRTGHLDANVVEPGWKRTRLKALVEAPVAGAWGADPEGDDQGPLPCVRAADFDRRRYRVNTDTAPKRVVQGEVAKKLRLEHGDLLIEKSGGGDLQPVGFVVRFDSEVEAIYSNFVARLRPRPEWLEDYVALVFIAAYELGMNTPFIKQTTGIQNLDLPGFLGSWWAVPDRDAQTGIVDKVSLALRRLDRLRAAIEEQIRLLEQRRQTVITDAVSGQPAATRPTPPRSS